MENLDQESQAQSQPEIFKFLNPAFTLGEIARRKESSPRPIFSPLFFFDNQSHQ